jgi:predicted transcriptional regulator
MSTSDTSRAALRRIRGRISTDRANIVNHLRERGPAGAADCEIGAALNLIQQTVSPRRGELVAEGVVVDSGMRRRTPSGRTATVWVLAEFAPKPTAPPSTVGGGLFET